MGFGKTIISVTYIVKMGGHKVSFYIAGIFGCIFSTLMFIPAIIEYLNGMLNFDIFINSACFGLFLSLLIVVTNYTKDVSITHHSAFLATTLVWFFITFISAIPLYFARYNGYSLSVIDALFESSSGMTTTGLTVLSGLEYQSKGILLWRAMLQFFGGAGIITFVFYCDAVLTKRIYVFLSDRIFG